MNPSCFEIGDSAGKIYRVLESQSPVTLTKLKSESGIEETAVLHQAIGWLAREGKIHVEQSGKSIRFSLKA